MIFSPENGSGFFHQKWVFIFSPENGSPHSYPQLRGVMYISPVCSFSADAMHAMTCGSSASEAMRVCLAHFKSAVYCNLRSNRPQTSFPWNTFAWTAFAGTTCRGFRSMVANRGVGLFERGVLLHSSHIAWMPVDQVPYDG